MRTTIWSDTDRIVPSAVRRAFLQSRCMPRWMRARRMDPAGDTAVADAVRAFRRTLRQVEAAKSALAGAAPGGRTAGAPLAGALLRFDEGLSEASASMDAW